MLAVEAAAASTRGLTSRVLQADTLVVAEAQAYVDAHLSRAIVSGFTLALEVAGLGNEETICVRVAVHLLAVHLARVRALGLVGLKE